jgi:hypothetical protein
VGPCCLNQPKEKTPIVSCAVGALFFRVLLPSHITEPRFGVLGAHAGCTSRSAVREFSDGHAQFTVGRSIVVYFDRVNVYREGLAWRLPPCV